MLAQHFHRQAYFYKGKLTLFRMPIRFIPSFRDANLRHNSSLHWLSHFHTQLVEKGRCIQSHLSSGGFCRFSTHPQREEELTSPPFFKPCRTWLPAIHTRASAVLGQMVLITVSCSSWSFISCQKPHLTQNHWTSFCFPFCLFFA